MFWRMNGLTSLSFVADSPWKTAYSLTIGVWEAWSQKCSESLSVVSKLNRAEIPQIFWLISNKRTLVFKVSELKSLSSLLLFLFLELLTSCFRSPLFGNFFYHFLDIDITLLIWFWKGIKNLGSPFWLQKGAYPTQSIVKCAESRGIQWQRRFFDSTLKQDLEKSVIYPA